MSENSHDSQAGRGHSPGARVPLDPAELRRLAEQKVKAQDTEAIANLSREEVCRLVHELRVHQIELETQNAHELPLSLIPRQVPATRSPPFFRQVSGIRKAG